MSGHSGEHGARLAEGQVCGDRDGGSFFAFGDDLEEQLGAAGVDLDVAELVKAEQVEASVAANDPDKEPQVGLAFPGGDLGRAGGFGADGGQVQFVGCGTDRAFAALSLLMGNS